MKPQNEREEQIRRILRKLSELPEAEQERILELLEKEHRQTER